MFPRDEHASEKGGSSPPAADSLVLMNDPLRNGEDEKSVCPEGGFRGWSVVLGV